jgi:cephalosporin-C deacetylase-like acetyl esterase
MPSSRALIFSLTLFSLVTLGRAKARGADAVAEALGREIIGPRQTLAETKEYAAGRIVRMPDVKSVAEWEAYAARTRAEVLRRVIFRGKAADWRDAKTRVEWLETIEGGPGYRIKKLRFEALPGLWVPALLYEPEKLEGKVPAVLNVNGHDSIGKAVGYKQIRCINQAKRGIYALNLEWFGMGQFKTDDFRHDQINHIDLCGTSGVGAHYLAMTRGIDILLSLEHTDPERIAVTGLSGGGWQTIFVSAFDTRVKLSNPVAGYSSFHTRAGYFMDLGDSEQTPNDLAAVTDYAVMTAMMAPRPTLLTFNAKDDCCFTADHALPPLMDAAGPIFKLHGKEANLRSHVNRDPGTHNYLIDNRQALYRMLGDHFFAGDSSFDPKEIPSDKEVKTKEQLDVSLPADNQSLHGLALALSKSLPRKPALPVDRDAARLWIETHRERLREVVRAKQYGAHTQASEDSSSDGLKSTNWRLKVGDWSLPVVELVRESNAPKGTTLLVADKGRKESATAVKALLDRGQRVLAVDPFYVGESKVAEKDYLFALLLASIGDRPLGLQATELAAVARWASSERKLGPVQVAADGPRTSVMALVASALEADAIAGLELRGSYGSLKELIETSTPYTQSPELFCFGLLEQFDILQLASLSAPRPVVFVNPSDRAKSELSGLKEWYKTWGVDLDPLRSEVSRLFTASEFPRLAERGIELPRAGKYTLNVWTPARQSWTLSAAGKTITLSSAARGTDATPRWQNLGAVELPGNEAVKVVVVGPASKKPKQEKAEAKSKTAEAAKKKAAEKPAPIPVPAILALSTDPSYDPSAALDLLRGRLDSVDPPPDPRRTHVRTNQQGADFRSPATVQAWRDRAQAVREQMLVTEGLWPLFPKTPLHPQVVGKLERDGYTIEKVVLETFPGFTLSGDLYRPIGKPGKLPGVLCPHGHWKDGRVNPEVQQRCIRWAKLGAVVFMYDMVGYNDSKPFGHAFSNDRLRRWGLSLVTLQTWNSIRALDWLTTLPDVDPARIGCTGESGGGTQTFLLTAIDDRIKVSAPVVMVSDSFQGGCVCENCAGLRIGTDNVEFAALCAPRPLELVGATGDWTKLTMTHAYPTLRDVYSLYGTTSRVHADVFDFEHNYNQTSRNAVYAFMGRWLLGIEDSASTREGEQKVEKPEDLWTFTDKTPAPPNRKTPAQLENDLIRSRAWELDTLAPSSAPAPWQAARELLSTSLKVRVGLVNPSPAELDQRVVRRTSRAGVTAVHSLVGRKAVGESIAVVRLIPRHATGRLTVIASPHGKAFLSGPDGQLSPLARALLERGQSVVGFDPLFVGESLDPSTPVHRRPETAHFETYNPTLAADQMQDLATVLAWARSQPDVREVSLIAHGRSGPQVLIARPALEGVARTAIDLHGAAEADGSAPLPPELDLPGLLQFGGLKAAAALCSPAPVWIYRLNDSFDRSWPENAYVLSHAPHVLRLDTGIPSTADLARWIDQGE